MQRIRLALLLVALLAGCAGVPQKPLSGASAAVLKNQTLIASFADKPDFAAWTPGKIVLAGGLFGGMWAVSAGNGIVEENHVPDPAAQIAYKLTLAMAARYGADAKPRLLRVNSDAVEDIADTARASTRYIVDVRTLHWGLSAFPGSWWRYRVQYAARARLIDTWQRLVLAEGRCDFTRLDDRSAPTYDELVDRQAAGLKWELGTATALCVNVLQQQMRLALNGSRELA
ncbi:hypothetical protein [Paludibacterium sp.]|uniref:hypothetical protein n=1 Tax=Paludibacterium sp. TaxID=1917523 RepID=UPI0025F26815|nr:hypothetical protein [Paludibacterium sp.]MBV8647422.1 hypothetical protein [Paludibacterium sp.]